MISENNIGLLCAADDTTALFNAIKQALINDYTSVKNNARQYAEEFLSIDKIMRHFKENVIGVSG